MKIMKMKKLQQYFLLKMNNKLKVFFLFIVAFLPRVINLGGHNIFVDEITWMSRSKDVYGAIRTLSWHPQNVKWWLTPNIAEAIGLPVVFLSSLSMAFLSSGYSHYSLDITRDFVAGRVPVVFLGSLFVPLFYLLVRKHINDKVAFLSSLLFALDPIAIALSRWLHHDTAIMLFSFLSILIYLDSKNRWSLVASAFFASLAILTKPQGFLVPMAIGIGLAIDFIQKRQVDVKKYVIWVIISALFTILFFPYLWEKPIGNMLTYLRLQIGNVDLGNLTYFNGQITSSPPWYYYFVIFPFRVPESVLFGILVGIFVLFVNFKKFIKNKLVRMVVIYSLLFLMTIIFSSKKLGIRYLLGIWPYLYVLAVGGLVYFEKFIMQPLRKFYWMLIFVLPIIGVIKFYPNYYLYHNYFISPQNEQKLESIGYCDSVKTAIGYLGPKLYHGVKIMLMGCDSAINYYTGYTIERVYGINQKPDYIIEETHNSQKQPEVTEAINKSGYKEVKQIVFRGLVLAKIYEKGVVK